MERFSDQWPFGLSTCRTFDHSDQCTIFGPTFGPTTIRNIELSPKIQVEGYGQGQIWWSHLRSRFQSICLLFIMWQPDHFWQRYSKFCIWPWKFKVNVTAKVKFDGHIWGLEFDRHVCFLFRGNCIIFDWDTANSIFDLENSRSRSRPRSAKI